VNAPGPIEEGRTASFQRHWLAERPDLDPEALALELTVARIGLLARKSLERLTGASGVSGRDYTLMAMIKRGGVGGALRPSDLWKRLQLSPATVTYHIARLADRGLVVRETSPDDRRAVLLKLTSDGDRLVDSTMTAVTKAMAERLADFGSDADRRALRRLLDRLARRWEQLEEEPLEAHAEAQQQVQS
jgi:DNA-binding MarR family transcriptional regulator